MNPTQQKPTLIFEMLDQIQREPTPQARAIKMRQFRCRELNTALQINYRQDVKLDLPPGVPSFQRDNGNPDASMARTRNIINDIFELGTHNRNLSQNEKLSRFVRILEALNEREAEVFILAKDRKLQDRWPAINIHMVRDAIPGIV
jgi:hypothetical protein